jgi:hypothetical protein
MESALVARHHPRCRKCPVRSLHRAFVSKGHPTSGGEATLVYEAERKEADALLLALGPTAIQRASDQADNAELAGDYEGASYWRRVTALIAALSPTSL